MQATLIVKGVLWNRTLSRVLLVQRSKAEPFGTYTWENAGGKVEYGETPEAAIRRELWEETGIRTVTIQRMAYAALIYREPPLLILVYLCETPMEQVILSDEHQAYLWADAADCRRLLPKDILSDYEKNGIFDLLSPASAEK